MSAFERKLTGSILLAVTILIGAAAPANAACDAFPKHPLWTKLSHGSVERYINIKLDGDWDRYVSHLARQYQMVAGIQARGKSARVRYKGKLVTLSGDNLLAYVAASKKRLKVARCLAEEARLEEFNDFSTAAGDEQEDKAVANASFGRAKTGGELAAAGGPAVKLDIRSVCESGDTIFKITNKGAAWPKAGAFAIHRIGGGGGVISTRRLRLKPGQLASFRIKASRNPTGELGLFVNPTWYKRPFNFDARLSCR